MRRDSIDYSKYPEADVVINHIVTRKKKGYYTLCLVGGLPGTGKSSLCLRAAERVSEELLGKNIITSNNIVDDLLGFIKFVRNADPNKVEIAIIEEVSVLFPSRRAMSHDNVAIGKILDTARKKQVILFANAPIIKSIDSHLRALSHIYVETLRIVKTQGVVISKALRLQTNPGSGKTYLHKFNRRGKEVDQVIFRKPNMKTWEEYEIKKDKFMETLYDELKFRSVQKQEKLLKEMGKKTAGVVVQKLSPKEQEVYDLKFKKNMRNFDIARELNVNPSRITHIITAINSKMAVIHKELPTCDTFYVKKPLIQPIM